MTFAFLKVPNTPLDRVGSHKKIFLVTFLTLLLISSETDRLTLGRGAGGSRHSKVWAETEKTRSAKLKRFL